ncbi:hypothetical protein [Mitsuokella sp.]|uniref:hypothetical protein n=1 Tax=Mitsuokella sp. TaxID=2049034 RepID=UPI002A823492|nr:hypothetical protein [Mitsuokella sp.]MDY4474792.1 hypothetical protein [Mitsuokella sp.]
MNGNHEAHACGCGCYHDHHDHMEHMGNPHDILDPEDAAFRQALQKMQAMAASMQGLHAEIDAALSRVSQQNVGYILTQQKNVRKLEQLYADCFAEPLDHPLYETMRQAEQEYLKNIRGILREARQLKHSRKEAGEEPAAAEPMEPGE